MKKINHHRQILNTLSSLDKEYPSYTVGKHISIALDGHDLWGILDKDFLQALKDYKIQLETDVPNDDIEDIIKQGMDLNHILDEEEED